MADYLGSFAPTGGVAVMFTTNSAAGAAVAPSTAFEAADVRVYKNGGATERASQNGYVMTSPFDSVVGLHLFTIDLTDNTTAGFWEVGSRYDIILVPDETIDSQVVVAHLGTFMIDVEVGMQGVFGAAIDQFNTDLGANAPTNDITGMVIFDPFRGLAVQVDSYVFPDAFHGAWGDGNAAGEGTAWRIFPQPVLSASTLALIRSEVDDSVDARIGTPVVDVSTDIASISTSLGVVDGIVDDIKLKTDTLPTLPPTNVALANIQFVMIDDGNHPVPTAGYSPTATRSIDGAAFEAATGTVAEVGNGLYQFDASQADMNGGIITFRFIATGAADRFLTIVTDAAF
jgi:hypothetical protein